MPCVVYWLYDGSCTCLQRHGYVGITERFSQRIHRHKSDPRFPPNFSVAVLFSGSREECLAMEERLRPAFGIGWNIFKGGRAGGVAPKSPEARAKMAAAAKARYANPEERLRESERQKGRHDHRGEKNPRHGVRLSDSQKKNISDARVGKGVANTNWMKRGPYSEEALAKMSEGSKRRWASARSTTGETGHAY